MQNHRQVDFPLFFGEKHENKGRLFTHSNTYFSPIFVQVINAYKLYIIDLHCFTFN